MKKWTITVTEEDGKAYIERENDGFSPMELLLILDNINHDICGQVLGEIKPEVKRVLVEREPKRTCGTCQWYLQTEGVCCNGDSKHRADFVSRDGTCPEWGNYDVEMWGEEP